MYYLLLDCLLPRIAKRLTTWSFQPGLPNKVKNDSHTIQIPLAPIWLKYKDSIVSIQTTKLRFKNQTFLSSIMVILCFSILLNNNSFPTFPAYSSTGRNISNPFSSTSSFQSKASILDNMPSQNITVGDINIAYKQIGKAGAKPIILITGASATMDMWNPLLLERLALSKL